MNAARRVPGKVAGALLGFFVALDALAQQGAASTASAPGGGSSAFASMLQVMVALVVVLALIAAFAWLMRRLTQGRNFGGELVKVRGGVMLGPKERAVLLEVADTWIVVGIGSGQVNALHAMPRPPGVAMAETSSAEARTFNSWLQQTLRDKTTVAK